MVAMIIVLGLFVVFVPIVDGSITNSYYIHERYNMQRAFMGGLKEAYLGESLEGAMDLFLERFEMSAPKGFEYTIDIMNFKTSPKLLHVRVSAVGVGGIEMEFEKSLVEEMQDETGS